MGNYKFTADYSCDLPKSFWEENDVVRCIMPYTICGKEYMTDDDITDEEYFRLLSEGNMATTSQINQYDAEQKFDKILSEGYDIIHLSLSGGVTSSVDNFAPTVKSLLTKYPDRKIEIVDTLTGSASNGILLRDCIELQKAGKSYDEVLKYIYATIPKLHTLFMVEDLQHLRKSGRLNTIEATIGSLLGIKPILKMNEEGKISAIAKARGTKKGLSLIAEDVAENIIIADNSSIIITHADNIERAEKLGEFIQAKVNVDIEYVPLTKIIGSHVGKDTVAVFYKGKARF